MATLIANNHINNEVSTQMPTQQVEMGHLQHPDEATKEILDLIMMLAAHGVSNASTAKKPMQCNCLASLSSQLEEASSFTDH